MSFRRRFLETVLSISSSRVENADTRQVPPDAGGELVYLLVRQLLEELPCGRCCEL